MRNVLETILDIFKILALLAIMPFIYLGYLIGNIKKCKYWKHCKSYYHSSETCNKNQGNFYGVGFEFRPGGCYRSLDSNGKLSQYWKD